jgi:uncharacterized membrane protein YeiH
VPLYILDLIGVAVFAASGALAAVRKRMDVFGVIVIGAVTAVGGGTLRDLLLDRHPVFWMSDPAYLVVILVAALLTLTYVRYRRIPRNALAIADAFGLAVFTIGGAQVAERAGMWPPVVVLMATMTGVAGGVLRDVLCAEIPLILRPGDIYATASIAGAASYLLAKGVGVPVPLAAVIGVGVVMLLRLGAILRGLHLPAVTSRND